MVLTRDMTVYRRKGKKGYFENEIKLPSIVYIALHKCTSALFLGTPQRVPESDSYLFACALTLLYINTYCFFCLLKGFLLPRKCLCILIDVAYMSCPPGILPYSFPNLRSVCLVMITNNHHTDH